MSKFVLVTVDTEEEGLWGGVYRTTGNTVTNVVDGVPRFQELCERLGVRPVYLVDYPVVEDDRASEVLANALNRGACEIGAHLHPWCNPPHMEYSFPRDSYMMNLPADVQAKKLEVLTEAIESRFGVRPLSFRAGRYGLDIHGARMLRANGYLVDSSVIAFSRFTSDGGPDFSEAPWQPYWIDTQVAPSLLEQAETGDLLEVPVSVGYTRAPFGWRHRLRQRLEKSWLRNFKAVGFVDRIGLARRVKFSPEQANAACMCAFVDAADAQGSHCLVMMFHSSSLVPGFSPYVRDRAALDEFLRRIELTLNYCYQRGYEPTTFKDLWMSARAGQSLRRRSDT